MATVKMQRETEEYLRVQITVQGVLLDAQPVALAVTSGTERPTTWLLAAWDGDPGSIRVAQAAPGWMTGMTPGSYKVWAKITDVPEVPVLEAGKLTIQ